MPIAGAMGGHTAHDTTRRDGTPPWWRHTRGAALPRVFDACGPVVVSPEMPTFSNNVAELFTFTTVAEWLSVAQLPGQQVMVFYDSEHFYQIGCGNWRPHANFRLAARARHADAKICSRRIKFQHVDSHSGVLGNERADKLADAGRSSRTMSMPLLGILSRASWS